MIVVFKKQVHGCFASGSTLDKWLSRKVEMPFVPPVGMDVCEGDWGATVVELVYKDGIVYAFTSADKELYNHGLHRSQEPCRTVDEIVVQYVEDGWVVSDGILSE
jgi:hypothetical protein